MGMYIKTFNEIVLPSQTRDSSHFLQMPSHLKPGKLLFVRIYERRLGSQESIVAGDSAARRRARGDVDPREPTPLPDLSFDTWDIVKDALIDLKYGRAQEIVSGALGPWRTSTVVVDRLVDHGTQYVIVNRTNAHALWNVCLDHPMQPNTGYQLTLDNITDEERILHPHLVFRDLNGYELAKLAGHDLHGVLDR